MVERINDSAETAEAKSDSNPHGFRVGVLSAFLVVLAAIISVVFMLSVQKINQTYDEFEKATDNYLECESAANDMKEASNYLTIQVRSFIVTQDTEYFDNYFEEANVNMRREKAVATLESLDANDSMYLSEALTDSVELMDIEYYAMKLVCEAKGYQSLSENATLLESVDLKPEDAALSPDDKIALATELVFSDEYMQHVARIESNVQKCKEVLVDGIDDVRDAGAEALHQLILVQQVLTVVLFAVVLLLIISVVHLILWPIRTYITHIKKNSPLPNTGAYELRYLVKAYNEMYDDNLKNHDALRRKAEHDHLTGLYNRRGFLRELDRRLSLPETQGKYLTLFSMDMDRLKSINDIYGHHEGDYAIQCLAQALEQIVEGKGICARYGGDEFAFALLDEKPLTEKRDGIRERIEEAARKICGPKDYLISASLGAASCQAVSHMPLDQALAESDRSLYADKRSRRER